MTEVTEILEERNKAYGASWLTATTAISAMTENDASKLQGLMDSGHLANWVIIISKICRAITTPDNPDHWRDIAGYAELSRELIEGNPEKYGAKVASLNEYLEALIKANSADNDAGDIPDQIFAQVDKVGNWRQLELPFSKMLNKLMNNE